MRYIGKKIALGCLAGVLAATGLTGCSSKMDGSSVAVTVNGEQVPLGVVSFMTRYQQAQTQAMYEMYFGGANDGLWDQVSDEKTGETYGESARDDVVEQVEVMYLLREKAKDYDVKITKKEQKKITEAAKQFIEANSQATLENLAVTQADIETALELQTYEKKMFDPMVADVDTKVSDNEAQQTTVTYVTVEEKDTEEGGDSASDNEEKAKEATAKEKAQQILDEALATANADMDAIAKDVDEELSATETHFTANPPEKEDDEEEEDIGGVPQSVQDVVKDLADGEVASELVEEDGTYYVVRLEKAFDEESTNEKKDSIISERKQDMYDDMIEDWKDKADIQVDKKVLKTLKVTANRKFTFKQEEETEDVSDNEADQEEVSSNESEEAQDSDQGEDEAPEAQEKDTEE